MAVSTGQQCTRSGKLDGYCSEKHKEQASALWGGRQPGANPYTDSEAEHDSDEDKPKKATKTTKATKALKAVGIKKSAAVDNDDDTVRPAPVPVTEPEEPKVATKKAVTAKATKKAPAPRKAASAGRKKKVVESSDEFEPESDGDYAPDDSEDDDSDFDDSDDDADDVEELSGKMASIKIQPNKSDSPARTEEDGPLKTKINRTKSKIFSTDAVLAPPKNKTKSSSASGRPTGGFWVPAPAPVKLPESTIKALSVIKEKLLDRQDSDDAVVPITNPHDAPDKKPSGLFKYKVRVHNYLHSHEEEADPDSKRATVRRLFHNIGSLFKPKQIITDTPVQEENKEEKKPAGGMVTTIKPSDKRRGSQDSVDSITKNINDLSVKADDGDDEFPNQCHGFNTSGHRCKRKVKLDRPQEKGEVLMCHDHEVNDEDEVVVHIEGKGGVLLQWLDVSGKFLLPLCYSLNLTLHG
jgi:hypothetical protein